MMQMNADQILTSLRAQANPENVAGMARFGINPKRALGISVNHLRKMAREIRLAEKDCAARHNLALALWNSRIHEAQILASIIDEPALVSEAQMEAWAADFDSWDLVDQCCGNLFDKTRYGCMKALEWSEREEEFVRRAGFSLMASIASHRKDMPDRDFEPFFEEILKGCTDERNFVKKAVNWALRGIGKRNYALNLRAIQVAEQMQKLPSRAARWNARGALRELQSRSFDE
jgi:3-methyladenine DNA glycosylase AlkD